MTDTSFVAGDLPTAVNSGFSDRTEAPSIIGLAGGGYVVGWESSPLSPSGPGDVVFQIFDASGALVGTATIANTTTADIQSMVSVAALTDGSFVVTWQSENQDGDGYGVYFQRFDATGTPQGTETQINTVTAGDQMFADTVGLAGGGFAVTWYEEVDNGNGTFSISVKMQKYTAAGALDGGQVTVQSEIVAANTTFGLDVDYSNLTIIELMGGEIAVSWDRYNYAGGGDATAQIHLIDATGTLIGGVISPEQTADQTGTYPQTEIVALGNGNFLVAYAYTLSGNGSGGFGQGEIFGRIYDATGTAVGNEFIISGSTDNRRYDVGITSDGHGGALVSYVLENDTLNERSLVVQQVAQDGTVSDELIYANPLDSGQTINADLALLANGDVVIVWEAYNQIQMRVLHDGTDGRFSTGSDMVTLADTGEAVAALEGNDTVTGGTGDDVIAGGSGADSISGGDGNDVLHGGADDDEIDGGGAEDLIFGDAGSDTITGGDGNDTIIGGTGDDSLYGDANDDTIFGGSGSDTIFGGEGADRLYAYGDSYNTILDPFDADQDVGVTNYMSGGGGDDRIYGASGDDVINGEDGDDWLYGGIDAFAPSGDDTFIGSAGDDILRGFDGNDTADYSQILGPITVAVARAGTSLEHIAVDIPAIGPDPSFTQELYDIERIIGTAYSDTITGSDDDQTFVGGAGNDTLDGVGGTNTASYAGASSGVMVSLALQGVQQDTVGAGLDTLSNFQNLTGSSHADMLTGDTGANTVSGKAGTDIVDGGDGDDFILGGNDNDWLFGNVGSDTANGGNGNDFFAFDNNQTNTGDVVADYAAGDTVYFGNRVAGPVFSISGSDVIVNGVTLTGAASGNVEVITQSSGAVLSASAATLAGVLSSGHAALAGIAGAYTRTIFDADGGESWSTDVYVYDAAGALDYRTLNYDTGGRLHINYDQTNGNGWSQIADTYNASNQLTQKVTTLDTGALYTTLYDVDGTQPWTQSTTGKDASNQTDYQDITYDDDTRIFTDYDQDGVQPWVTALTFYNELGQQTARRVNYDDGHYEVTYEDFDGSQDWTQKIDTYTDGVNRDYVNFYNDDGTRKTTDFDQLGTEDWEVREVVYDAAGQAVTVNTVYDDGTRILKTFDPDDANNTQEVLVGYDTGGLADYISTLYDDDTRITRDFDQNDDYAWVEHVFVYDATGNLTNDYYTY